MLVFRRYIKQSNWTKDNEFEALTSDDILIWDAYKRGFVKWEFLIDADVKIGIYSDAFKALKNKRLVATLVKMQDAETLDEIEEILKKAKFKEVIE